MIGGDMNNTITIHNRISSSSQIKKCPVPNLKKIMDTFKLIVAWRLFNLNKTQLTLRRKNTIEKSRINLWLFDSKYSNVIYSSDIRPAQISSTDHLAKSLKIKITTNRGPGIWRFNNSLLKDKNYKNLFQD